MNLSPTELERLTIFGAAELARRYKSQGIRLSHPEAVAFITDEVLTAARRGLAHADLVALGGSLLTSDDVEPGVPTMIPFIAMEANMEQGTKLVAIFDPVKPGKQRSEGVVPGEIIPGGGDIEINAGRKRATIEVINTGDRAIQVRSHAHFFEVNRALKFDREKAYGMRLDRPSGTGMRFDPGAATQVELVAMAGKRLVLGFSQLTEGALDDPAVKAAALKKAKASGYQGI
jgi:urease subunit gamma/beta